MPKPMSMKMRENWADFEVLIKYTDQTYEDDKFTISYYYEDGDPMYCPIHFLLRKALRELGHKIIKKRVHLSGRGLDAYMIEYITSITREDYKNKKPYNDEEYEEIPPPSRQNRSESDSDSESESEEEENDPSV